MSTPAGTRKAEKTGRTVQHEDGTLHEVICYQCAIPQFHRQGIARCVVCDARLHIVGLEIIRATIIKNEPVEIPAEENRDPI